jgi:glycosyltransferase involved in cell wall biosynthesis
MQHKVLYLSYTGMMEALGASQVLNYLYGLSENYEFYLITLEKGNDFFDLDKKGKLNEKLSYKNIHWYPVLYKRGAKGFVPNFCTIYRLAKKILNQEKITLIHCRSYFPATIAYLIKKQNKLIKYIFDTRSFAFDERAERGSWSRKRLFYKLAKKLEKKLYLSASHVIMLSHKGKETIQNNELFKDGDKLKNITVIPTCVNLDKFTLKNNLQDNKKLTIGYIGNVRNWYDFDFTLQVLSAIKQQHIDYKLLIFNAEQNGEQHEYIKKKLTEYDINNYFLEKVSFYNMPARMKEIDMSIFFIRPLFSKKASAATKLGELLATGIPVITNDGVGDHKFYVEQHSVGKIIEKDKIVTYDFEKIIADLNTEKCRKRCREVAEKYFSLEKGIEQYKEIYYQLLKENI